MLKKFYSDLSSDKLGFFNKYKVSLKLKEDAIALFFQARPVTFSLRDAVGKDLSLCQLTDWSV